MLQPINRIKAVYFTYLASGGVMATYLPWHLDALGFGAAALGIVFGGRTLIQVFTQPLLTGWSDRIGRPMWFLKIMLTLSLLALLPMPWAATGWWVGALVWFVTPFQTTTLPLLDTAVMRARGSAGYGRVRLWGSLGFGVSTSLFAWFVRDASYADAGRAAVWVMIVFAALAAVSAWTIPPDPHRREPVAWSAIARMAASPRLLAFLSFNIAHWAAILVFNTYLALHIKEKALGAWLPGACMLVAILAEVVALRVATTLFHRRSEAWWLAATFAASAVRWVGIAWADSEWEMLLWQLPHFLSFGIWFSAVMALLGQFAPPEQRGALQGVFSAIVFGLGGIVGTIVGGRVMEQTSGEGAFLLAAALEVVALVSLPLTRRAWTSSRRDGGASVEATRPPESSGSPNGPPSR